MFLLCFTSAPFWAWYSMGMKYAGINRPPAVIVVLGGGGMPSESGLIRTWYAAKVGNHYTRSKIIIALPGDTLDSLSSVYKMKEELVLRGISPNRISFEAKGTNTRAQALNVHLNPLSLAPPPIGGGERGGGGSILIVTSPEHLYRAVLAFRKAGFSKVDGLPAFEATIESELIFDDVRLGGHKWMPHIGKNLTLRYQFWTQLHYEQLVIREWLAVGYYWMKGWL
jgi:uncharacterized SAM-binding protein YcdF (DUF218 family)